MSLIKSFEWRYAAKKCDTSKRVAAEVILNFTGAIGLSFHLSSLSLYAMSDLSSPTGFAIPLDRFSIQ